MTMKQFHQVTLGAEAIMAENMRVVLAWLKKYGRKVKKVPQRS